MWRVSSADRMIRSGCAQIPHRGNDGHLFVKAFVRKSGRSPLPQAKMQEAIAALTAKAETESLTRPQQQEFLRRMFPAHHVTTRQLAQIFQSVPVAKGRSKKSRKKV
jgi:hypothetical protein